MNASVSTVIDPNQGLIGVTAATGFLAAGVAAGIKHSGAKDVALVVNNGPEPTSAGVFTPNRFCAAPVTLTRQHLAFGPLKAVVLNSGGANACTGAQGMVDAQETANEVAAALGVTSTAVGVCSTGMIGELLPMDAVKAGIRKAADMLSSDPEAGLFAADAIRTTDTVPKSAVLTTGGFTVGGMVKGAGMLAPALATMLCVITTDAVVPPAQLDAALHQAVATTFNRTDSDGCMSTNDTVLVLASGASGVTPPADVFTDALHQVCASLSYQLINDAEGASHNIAVTVQGATTEAGAETVARQIARSNLFKTAMYGNDPNWGRVVSEVGTVPASVAPYDPTQVDVTINGVTVCRGGGVGEPRENVTFDGRDVSVVVDLHAGSHRATVWTNDLTHDYVHINADYSS